MVRSKTFPKFGKVLHKICNKIIGRTFLKNGSEQIHRRGLAGELTFISFRPWRLLIQAPYALANTTLLKLKVD
jgi:hypothetical protein